MPCLIFSLGSLSKCMEEELHFSLPYGLKGNILRLPHFFTEHTVTNSADVLVTVQGAESFSSALFLSKFLQNILQVCVFGIKELEAQMTAHFCLSATSLGYFNLTSIRQKTLQETER